MAEKKPNAAPRPNRGVRRSATPSGVTHVRTYQSGRYVVVGNHLAQHRRLSLTAIGLATHIMSVPEGTPVDIRSLADRFPEGRDRIAFALRELEAHGYLERVREHTESGRLVTRTYVHHTPVPAVAGVAASPARARTTRAPVAVADVREGPEEDGPSPRGATAADTPGEEPAAAAPPPPPRERAPRDRHHESAVTLLAGLRRTDDRLTLSLRDVNRLAPGVVDWFDSGASAAVVHRALTADLPPVVKHPAGLLAHRLGELLPPPLPAPPPPPVTAPGAGRAHGPHPFQTCDGCERAFRAPTPGHCRDCRSGPTAATAPATGTTCAA
ncbi:helix-turn-helix domain-containing protein [Streptomyces sp. TG1A-8]|uniref:helix-turn-helix domain-containing protein n=1 Tax=Streptomyces sp. TG1A-8 TaxID=3051385 RepID=UPI00265B812D|nr:helix-turn-helix domain-containing protein [Streptomyces sp. TG1A-8]MDO0926386.1 helix-turn-helix domain-containing protein [Streptomyces sp. TG1A-8]